MTGDEMVNIFIVRREAGGLFSENSSGSDEIANEIKNETREKQITQNHSLEGQGNFELSRFRFQTFLD